MKLINKILAINIGSTSTKVGIYKNVSPVLEKTFRHNNDTLESMEKQYNFRKELILNFIKESKVDIYGFNGIVCRGGLLKPMEGGTYIVNDKMISDLKIGRWGKHPVNLSGIIAAEIGGKFNIPAFMVDPIVVDELDDIARISGHPFIERRSIFHALNQKAVARSLSSKLGKPYEKLNLIVAHIGGGVTVGVHKNGRVIDVNNAYDGDGPFSAERPGGLPVGEIMKLCYSGKYSYNELKKELTTKSGLIAYLGTNDGIEVVKRIKNGDVKAKLIYEAMAYQISKEIASCAAVLKGEVDAIVLTGGFSYDDMLVKWIKSRVKFISDIVVMPGEDEMKALIEGALRVLNNKEKAKEYR